MNFMKSIGHYFCPTVLRVWCVHMACWHFTLQLCRHFEIRVLLTILIRYTYTYFIRDTTEKKKIKLAILKHNWNVERLIEHVRQDVVWELSCDLWLEKNLKLFRNVSFEYVDKFGTDRHATDDNIIWFIRCAC